MYLGEVISMALSAYLVSLVVMAGLGSGKRFFKKLWRAIVLSYADDYQSESLHEKEAV